MMFDRWMNGQESHAIMPEPAGTTDLVAELLLCNDPNCAEDRPCVRHRAADEIGHLDSEAQKYLELHLAEIKRAERAEAERDRYKAALEREWEANHAEHCTNMTLSHEGTDRCHWAKPVELDPEGRGYRPDGRTAEQIAERALQGEG